MEQTKIITTNEHQWLYMRRKVFMVHDGAGCVIAEIPTNKERKPLIYNLHVEVRHRRKGYATALLDAAEDWLRKQGSEEATLEWDGHESEYWVLDWYVRRGYDEKEFGNHSSLLEKRL